MMKAEAHVHDFKRKDTGTILNGMKRIRGEVEIVKSVTARDTLKQWVCDCGQIETFDLKRKKL